MPCLAKLWLHFVLDGLDSSPLASASSMAASTSLSYSPHALWARGFICIYLDTDNPDHGNSHHYHNKGCTAQRSRRPLHRHKGLPPCLNTSSTSLTVEGFTSSTPSMIFLLLLQGDVSSLVYTSVSLPFNRPRCPCCSRRCNYDCGGS